MYVSFTPEDHQTLSIQPQTNIGDKISLEMVRVSKVQFNSLGTKLGGLNPQSIAHLHSYLFANIKKGLLF